MACSGLCKVQLRSVEPVLTATGLPSVRVTQGGGDLFAGTAPDGTDYKTAVADDVAKRTRPISLDPRCDETNCRCSVITSTFGEPPYDEKFPVKIVKKGVTTIFEYDAKVRDGVGDGVCVDKKPKLLSALVVIGEGEFALVGDADTLTPEKVAAVSEELAKT